MPTPSSGAISLNNIAAITKNASNVTISMDEFDTRALLGVPTGQISMSSAYNKPTAGSASYGPGSYTFIVPAYQYLSATVAGGGGGGGGGCGGQLLFVPGFGLICVNFCASSAGTAGNQSSFNGVISYGGGGGANCGGAAGSNGGNNQNGNLGGGGGGGGGGVAGGVNCSQSNGGAGGAGGIASFTWQKAVNGPAYGASINFSVGAGGTGIADGCRPAPGGNGGNGYVNVSWS